MSETKKHWRMGGKLTHCGVECLPDGEDVPHIVIQRIVWKNQVSVGGNKQDGFEAIFAPNQYTKLPMWLNSTNKKRLAKLGGTDYLEDIKNLPVALTKELTRDPKDGKSKVWGLRISKNPAKTPVQPKPTPAKTYTPVPLTGEHENWDKCVGYMKGGGKIEELKKKYTISEEVESQLKTEANGQSGEAVEA